MEQVYSNSNISIVSILLIYGVIMVKCLKKITTFAFLLIISTNVYSMSRILHAAKSHMVRSPRTTLAVCAAAGITSLSQAYTPTVTYGKATPHNKVVTVVAHG